MGCTSTTVGSPGQRGRRAQKTSTSRPAVYIWPGSAPCRAVLMAAQAANVDLEVKQVDLLIGEHEQDAFLKINPDDSVPTLLDGKVMIGDSRAILQYLVELCDGSAGRILYPEAPENRELVDRMLDWEHNTAFPAVTEFVYPQVFSGKSADPVKVKHVEELLTHLEVSVLSDNAYVSSSHLTLADLMLVATLSLLELVSWDFRPYRRVVQWQESIRGLPYYAKCNQGLEDWKVALMVGQGEGKGHSQGTGDIWV